MREAMQMCELMAFLFEHATAAARMEKSTIDSSTRGRRRKIDENLYNQRSKNNFFQCFSLPQLSADVKRRKEKLYLGWKKNVKVFLPSPEERPIKALECGRVQQLFNSRNMLFLPQYWSWYSTKTQPTFVIINSREAFYLGKSQVLVFFLFQECRAEKLEFLEFQYNIHTCIRLVEVLNMWEPQHTPSVHL